ncbi:MAG: hypothetical protein IKY27_01805 [Bacteroidales bacterium]|nr:hypothetical protein [Bacteroidales bacterium]
MLPYLKYRLKSQGKFRLHSPFVYDFYEEVLEQITRENWREELCNKLNAFLLSKEDVFKENDVYIIEEDIHLTKENEMKWNAMKNMEDVRLSIDCYHFGIIFKMERKEKQHFVLSSRKFRKSKSQKK